MRRIGAALLLLVCSCASGGVESSSSASYRVVATPDATGRASVVVVTPKATPKPTSAASVSSSRASTAAASGPKRVVPVLPLPVADIGAFRKLGAWIDVFDHTADPASVLPHVRGAAKRGAKTLYLETGRYDTKGDFTYPEAMAAALDEAKALGMKVIGWYPPRFDDFEGDVKRSVAAIEYRSPKGNRFDAFAADIEYTAGVPDHDERNALTVRYSKRIRSAAGATYPLGVITIPASWLERTPERWPDFPWGALKGLYDVFMPMEYWTALGKDPETAYEVTRKDVAMTRSLTGKPVHIIGGLGADADGGQVDAYVKAAKETGALGGGLYDYTTTRADVWDELRKLN
jgi:hypothetical protein